jgi:hypothetical protein
MALKRVKPIPPQGSKSNGQSIKAVDFQVINFFDEKAFRADGKPGVEVILIYALGEDGVVREFAGGQWTAFPISGA